LERDVGSIFHRRLPNPATLRGALGARIAATRPEEDEFQLKMMTTLISDLSQKSIKILHGTQWIFWLLILILVLLVPGLKTWFR
jgi:hypothetical protein